MGVRIEKTGWQGWPNCYRIANGDVELIATSDVGPRIMRYAFPGAANVFAELPEQMGGSGEKDWMPRGGSRIWMAPEDRVRTYAPDNGAVRVVIEDGVWTAIQPVEPESGLEKQISVTLAAQGSGVEVVHRLKNASGEEMEIAPWVITMMAPGGMGISGFPPRGTHPEVLPPTHPLVMWAFTNLADPRWRFTRKYLLLRQEPGNRDPQKLGHFNADTWGAYLLGETLFLKRYAADASKRYTDFGCSFETFTNADVLELETLGPLERVPPGGMVEHVEHWSLHAGVKVDAWTDEGLDGALLPILAAHAGAHRDMMRSDA
jgi:hypothetical protein